MHLEDLPPLVPTEPTPQGSIGIKNAVPLLLILPPVLLGPPFVTLERVSEVRRGWEDASELNWEVWPESRAFLQSTSLVSPLLMVISLHAGFQ